MNNKPDGGSGPRALNPEASRQLLLRGRWFGTLDSGLQDTLLNSLRSRQYLAGQILSAEEQVPKGLFVVISGQVAVTRGESGGNEFIYYVGGPGFWFGEVAIIAESLTAVTITARTDTSVLFLSYPRFVKLVADQPDCYRSFARLLAHRYSIVLRNLAQSKLLPSDDFLRVRLADLVDLWRADGNESEVLEFAITQAELAQMVGVSRQTVNRHLAMLEKSGLVEVGFRAIRILDPKGLRGNR